MAIRKNSSTQNIDERNDLSQSGSLADRELVNDEENLDTATVSNEIEEGDEDYDDEELDDDADLDEEDVEDLDDEEEDKDVD